MVEKEREEGVPRGGGENIPPCSIRLRQLREVDSQRQPTGRTSYWFWCPGCDQPHRYDTPRWNFNGDMEKPTFHPSLKITNGTSEYCCHLFLEDGRIKFCTDCSHTLRGQTVELPPLPDWLHDWGKS